MEEQVRQYIDEQGILTGVGSVVLAVSGGADSMALAHFMSLNYPQYDYIVAHVNHGLRAEANAEEIMVRDFATKLGLSFISVDIDVALVANSRKIGLEEAGREVRYDFFRGLNRDIILTAHHKDDNAETVLAHIIRGSGIKGLRGILPVDNGIGRPFLGVTKAELVEYCRSNGIGFATDLSNNDTTYQRNKIRHEVMPVLAEINPNIVDGLCRLGSIAQGEAEALEHYTRSCYRTGVRLENGKLTLANKAAKLFPIGILRRVVIKMAEELGCPLDYRGTEKIISLKTGKKYCWGLNWVAEQTGRSLVMYQGTEVESVAQWCVDLELPGITMVPYCNFTVEITGKSEARPNKNTRAVVDSNCLGAGLVLRNRRQGDWFFLPNGGRKKLSDYFIDEKVPMADRDSIPLLAISSRILWIVGYRQCVPKGRGDITISLKNY